MMFQIIEMKNSDLRELLSLLFFFLSCGVVQSLTEFWTIFVYLPNCFYCFKNTKHLHKSIKLTWIYNNIFGKSSQSQVTFWEVLSKGNLTVSFPSHPEFSLCKEQYEVWTQHDPNEIQLDLFHPRLKKAQIMKLQHHQTPKKLKSSQPIWRGGVPPYNFE